MSDQNRGDMSTVSAEEKKVTGQPNVETDQIREAIELRELENKYRTMSDQALEFLRTHNIAQGMDSDLFLKSKDEGKKDGLTYNEEFNPLLNHLKLDPMVANRFTNEHAGNREYFDKRDKFPEMPVKEVQEILDGVGNPYGHGSHVADSISEYGLADVSYKTPAESVLKYGYGALDRFEGAILEKIDTGKMEFPEIEQNFLDLYALYTDIIPRFVTLLARDKNWKLEELDNYLVQQLGAEKLSWIHMYVNGENPEENNMKMRDIAKKKVLSEDDKQKLLHVANAVLEAFQKIAEYLKKKVSYANIDSV